MSSAVMTLTDNAGKLDMRVEYEGGLDERSPSHEHMLVLVGVLSEYMAQPIGEPVHILGMPDKPETEVALASRRIVLAS